MHNASFPFPQISRWCTNCSCHYSGLQYAPENRLKLVGIVDCSPDWLPNPASGLRCGDASVLITQLSFDPHFLIDNQTSTLWLGRSVAQQRHGGVWLPPYWNSERKSEMFCKGPLSFPSEPLERRLRTLAPETFWNASHNLRCGIKHAALLSVWELPCDTRTGLNPWLKFHWPVWLCLTVCVNVTVLTSMTWMEVVDDVTKPPVEWHLMMVLVFFFTTFR